MMKLRDFRVGFRILVKDPAYSLVAILGLGVGLAVCLLLLGYARYCWQYNAQVPDADNVYIVKQRNNMELGAPWRDQAPLLLLTAAKAAPGVMSASAYLTWFPLTVEVDGQLRKLNGLTALPGFAELLGLRVLKGDLQEALSRPDSFAITEGAAMRLFGTTDVLGRTLLLRLDAIDQNRSSARIAAILRDQPPNTTIPFDTLNGPSLALIPQVHQVEMRSGASTWPGNLLIHVRSAASLSAVTETLQQAFDNAPAEKRISSAMSNRLGGRKLADVRLARLRDAYFDHEIAANFLSRQVDRGDATVVAALAAMAILILALAAINYINLATIRVIRRQREIAMRKVLGASRARLALQFLAESLVVSLLATAIGLVLAWLAMPVFATLMNRDLSNVVSLGSIAAALGIGLILGLLTAIYPAWMAFGVRPSLMLAGCPGSESLRSKRLRQVLSVLQVAVAMGLASFTAAIFLQSRFAVGTSPGFDPAPLLVMDLPVAMDAADPRTRGFVAALSDQPGIVGVAMSSDPVGRPKELGSTEIKREGGHSASMDVKSVSANFFEQYGIKAVAGRLFDSTIDKEDDPALIVINAIAARQLGFASPELALEQTLLFRDYSQVGNKPALIAKRVVGVAPEVRFYSLREAPRAIVYELQTRECFTLTVRTGGSSAEAESSVRAVWPQYFPNSVLEMSSAKSIYAANYADDARLAKLLALATAIAMIIAAFGAYVLAADAVQRRTGEIALRRLFGARRLDVGKLIAGEIAAVVILSAVIAIPLAGLAIARYLAAYTEHTPIAFWTLAFALLAALVTTAFAAVRHAWIAMMLRPAVALRT
jgi:putative ABC transport system permease protein